MNDLPQSGCLTIALRDAHPAGLGFAFLVAATTMRQPVSESDFLGRFDGHLVELEDVRAGAHLHAFLPMGAVGRLALELQRLDRIEGDDVIGIQRHDFFHVLGHDSLAIAVDQVLDLGLRVHGGSPWFLWEDTLSRLAIR